MLDDSSKTLSIGVIRKWSCDVTFILPNKLACYIGTSLTVYSIFVEYLAE